MVRFNSKWKKTNLHDTFHLLKKISEMIYSIIFSIIKIFEFLSNYIPIARAYTLSQFHVI